MGLHGEWIETIAPSLTRRARFRKEWGSKGDKDGWLASRAFDLSRTSSHAQWVDDKTWTDLEFPSLFANIDTTVSPLGSQMLYKQLRAYQFDSGEMTRRYEAYDALGTDGALREECQLALTTLDTNSAAHLADLVMGSQRRVPIDQLLLFFLAGASVVALSLLIVSGLSPWLWISVLMVNAVLIAKMNGRIGRDAEGLSACSQMLHVAERLSNIRSEKQVSILQQLRAERSQRKALRRSIRWFSLASSDSMVFGGVAVLFNVCFLTRLIAYTRVIDTIAKSREHWISTFELVGSIDAAIAFANFLQRMPRHCRPTVSNDKSIAFENLYHPLLSNSVDCSINLREQSALVTGSNMTGKTTFVKSVAINIILGNTVGICLANAATIPQSGVMTSIRTDHSVESGKSRYFAEVDTIVRLLQCQSRDECRVFVFDEPFSGTNTVERIAIARAVLSAMSSQAQVLVTTHDVELQHLLGDAFALFHFREDPSVAGFFDYKLRTGASTERNAIKVLARMGFPNSIIENALKHVGQG